MTPVFLDYQPLALTQDSRLTWRDRYVYVYMAIRAGQKRVMWYTLGRMMQDLQIDKSNLSKIITRLCDTGWIQKVDHDGRAAFQIMPESVVKTTTPVVKSTTPTVVKSTTERGQNNHGAWLNQPQSVVKSTTRIIKEYTSELKSERDGVEHPRSGDSVPHPAALSLSPAHAEILEEQTEAELLAELQALQAEEETITPAPQPEPPAAPVARIIRSQNYLTLETLCEQLNVPPRVREVLLEFADTFPAKGHLGYFLPQLKEMDAPLLREYLASRSGDHYGRALPSILTWYIRDRKDGKVQAVATPPPAPAEKMELLPWGA